MSLSAGARLGTYEITGTLGAGGMGEVYRARDVRLHRDVAIKVLPDAVAQDADRRARFEREARTLASLNHPHIATVHGLEEDGGVFALVMELVEGPTLAEIDRGGPAAQSPKRVASRFRLPMRSRPRTSRGSSIATLKPANIKVRPDGTVKVLDFGLAKALDAEQRQRESGSPTRPPPCRAAERRRESSSARRRI